MKNIVRIAKKILLLMITIIIVNLVQVNVLAANGDGSTKIREVRMLKNEDLERITTGVDPSTTGPWNATPENPQWMQSFRNNGSATKVIETTDQTGAFTKALQVDTVAGGGWYSNLSRKSAFPNEPALTDLCVFDIKFLIPSDYTGTGRLQYVINNNPVEYRLIQIYKDSFELFGYDSPIYVNGITKDVWHRIQISFDTTNPAAKKCVAAYYDGELIAGSKNKLLNTDPTHPAPRFSALEPSYIVAFNTISQIKILIDDIKIYEPEPPDTPHVVSISPANDTFVDAKANTDVVITFSRNIDQTAANLNLITVVKNGTVNVPYTVVSNAANQCTLTIPEELDLMSTYKVTVPTSFKDTSTPQEDLAPQFVSYFSTRNSLFTEIVKLYKNDNFENQVIGETPVVATADTASRISGFTTSGAGASIKIANATDKMATTTNVIEITRNATTDSANIFPLYYSSVTDTSTPVLGNRVFFSTRFKVKTDTELIDYSIFYKDAPTVGWKLFEITGQNLSFLASEGSLKKDFPIVMNKWYDVSIELDTSGTNRKVVRAIVDGVVVSGTQNVDCANLKQINTGNVNTSYEKLSINAFGGAAIRTTQFDNIIIYEPKILSPLSVIEITPSETVNVPLGNTIDLKFNYPLRPNTLQGITVKVDGNEVSRTVSLVDADTCRIQLGQPMDFLTQYTVTVPNTVKDIYYQSLSQDYVKSFTTVMPPFYIQHPYFTDENGAEFSVSKWSAGQTVNVKTNVTNNQGTDGNVLVLIALYRDTQIIDYGYSRQFVVNGTNNLDMSASMTLPLDIAGCKLRAFVWNSFSEMYPFSAIVEFPQ